MQNTTASLGLSLHISQGRGLGLGPVATSIGSPTLDTGRVVGSVMLCLSLEHQHQPHHYTDMWQKCTESSHAVTNLLAICTFDMLLPSL